MFSKQFTILKTCVVTNDFHRSINYTACGTGNGERELFDDTKKKYMLHIVLNQQLPARNSKRFLSSSSVIFGILWNSFSFIDLFIIQFWIPFHGLKSSLINVELYSFKKASKAHQLHSILVKQLHMTLLILVLCYLNRYFWSWLTSSMQGILI